MVPLESNQRWIQRVSINNYLQWVPTKKYFIHKFNLRYTDDIFYSIYSFQQFNRNLLFIHSQQVDEMKKKKPILKLLSQIKGKDMCQHTLSNHKHDIISENKRQLDSGKTNQSGQTEQREREERKQRERPRVERRGRDCDIKE